MVCRPPLIVMCLLWSIALVAVGQTAWYDKIADLPAIGAPIINLSPETGWVFGGVVQGYFRFKDQKQTSMVQLSGAYSLRSQWYIHSHGTIYTGSKNQWMISYDVGYRHYPDVRFYVGNEFTIKEGISYLSERAHIKATALAEVAPGWSIGPTIQYLYDKTDFEDLISTGGIGLSISYDSRDLHFYPTHGWFFQVSGIHYEPFNGNFTRSDLIESDLRHFIPIYRQLLFAWQFRTQWSIGGAMPYQLLPSLGGEDLVRGLRANMFRDQALLTLQAELRIPIYRQLSGTVFAGIGDVYNYNEWQWAMPKVGYGLGLRVAINKSKINIRFDVARNNLYKSWNTMESYSFYLTTTEAF